MDTRSKEILDDEEEDLDQYSEFQECQVGTCDIFIFL